jgi:hypothetical protein
MSQARNLSEKSGNGGDMFEDYMDSICVQIAVSEDDRELLSQVWHCSSIFLDNRAITELEIWSKSIRLCNSVAGSGRDEDMIKTLDFGIEKEFFEH